MGRSTLQAFLEEQRAGHELKLISRDLRGKVVIVTGSNTGLGYETAVHLSRLSPAHLILACRSPKTGLEAVNKIKDQLISEKILQSESDSKTKIECWQLDLSDAGSVKGFAERVLKDLKRLDTFIANAAIAASKRILSKHGYEESLQINNISNTYLNSRILPLLSQTAKEHPDTKYTPHLTIVSSRVHYDVDDLPEKEGGKVVAALNELDGVEAFKNRYNETKLINLLDAMSLSRRFPDIIINTVHPGLNQTTLDRRLEEGEDKASLTKAKKDVGWAPELGSRNIVYAALGDEPSESYISRTRSEEPSDLVISPRGKELSEKIWEEYQTIWKEMF